MGSALSSEKETLPISERRPVPYYGMTVPPEASKAPQDSQDFYDEFVEEAYGLPHRDGKNVIICRPTRPDEIPKRPETWADDWALKNLMEVYKLVGEDAHPRIVRYVGALEGDSVGLVVEKLWPGPLRYLTLPVMPVPVPKFDAISRNDRLLLSLYYLWALQALSAMTFFHSRSICIRNFSRRHVWIRSDYSLAITGFISAAPLHDQSENEEKQEKNGFPFGYPLIIPEEDFDLELRDDDVHSMPSFKADLFRWATFVWRLMTNDFCAHSRSSFERWEPVTPMTGDPFLNSGRDVLRINIERREKNLFQQLKEERLGTILVNAWSGRYNAAEEVAQAVKAEAQKIGIEVVGDEIAIGEAWENIFEVVQRGKLLHDRELRFRAFDRD
ncbi:hypothetical protein CC80DRAFT_589314 [Byssothecium circinans]|uniref:Protein kinase domain-containing protein n=1 Tax=Byssothecium circinans TaxID=147558 RepID=A0A6A5U9H6_9PLEO|nr:hypothetical protein CC80DRAFT_589314 [Byssothecium circinans]